ncbi:hypothetical protein ASG25_15515 [Rhizobium sp. Leaf384]|uniref:hypothetical protein n=1 Tax=Rhizobium sp. Leaf384 TaxID=1736358 RepID=UPI0007125A07|nr:hypothetical protein [Rhizobium sp. Leaf384]KQS76828.1 hypothetical protein ASG25_15515 [Rhizobium sp. Leaf384]
MTTTRFAIIPGWIVTDTRLKGRDLQVLCLLGRHTDKHGWCRRSQVKMAGQLECARSTVQASLDRLSIIGVVEKHLEVSKDGRDSAHWYRVIFDQKVAEEDFEEWESEEFDPVSGAVYSTPPADISAPPADPESAPPADSGSAPINDPYLTTSDQLGERARARDLRDEEENPRSVERRFKKWWHAWPGYLDDSEMNAVRCWQALTPEQRKACEDLTPVYLAARDKMGRTKAKAASTYLSERQWERLAHADVPTTSAPSALHNPFSKAWQGNALACLLGPESPMPQMTASQARMVAQGGPLGERVRREHRERWAWPKVSGMYRDAQDKRGSLVSAPIVSASEAFRSFHVNSPEVAAWKRLYATQGWPWPEMGKHEWICFPTADGVDDGSILAALDAFKRMVTGDRGDEHAA